MVMVEVFVGRFLIGRGDTTSSMAFAKVSQYQAGHMYYEGLGVDVDYAQAVTCFEKAAAQDHPDALAKVGAMYVTEQGVPPSFRCAREYFERAIELGDHTVAENMQLLTGIIRKVTSLRRSEATTPPHHRPCVVSLTVLSSPRTHSTPPSWTSGWRSTARAGRT